jgi:hypothetical protein
LSLAQLWHTTLSPQEVALSAEMPLAHCWFIELFSASGTVKHRRDALASIINIFKRDEGAEPPPRRTRKAIWVDSLQHFHLQIVLQAGALRAFDIYKRPYQCIFFCGIQL